MWAMGDEIMLQEIFLKSSVPMLVLDITDLRNKCKEFQQSDLTDIDRYIDDEIKLKNICDSNSKIYFINKSALDIFGLSKIDNKKIYNAYSFNSFIYDLKKYILSEIFYGNTRFIYNYESQIINNKELKLKINIDILNINNFSYALISIFDISYYKKTESILTEFVEKYYLLLKTVNDSIVIVDIYSGFILEANDRSLDIFKVSMGELIGSKVSDFLSSKEINMYEYFFNKKISTDNDSKETLNIYIGNRPDSRVPVQMEVNTALVGGSRVAQLILHDMSNRFKMEEGRRLLAAAVEQAAESVVITDIYGNIQYVNPAFENITGYSFTEMLGKNPRVLQSGETPEYEYKLMWAEISKGNVWRGTFTNRKKNGEIFKEDATITPVKDNNDNIISYVAVKRDITQHLLLENQIRQSQKMQAIGTLAGGVAHDFNNILTAIMGYAELSQSQCDENSLLYNNLSEIISGADRAGKLVDQILQFSRQSEKNISSIELSLIVKEVIRLLRASLPANIELLSDFSGDYYVKADPTQMHQVVMNLCTNAYQALEGKSGCIQIRLYRRFLSPKEGVKAGNLPQGSYVCFQVEDSGTGIAPEYLQRIFEPYFTTKKMHEGNGLGLSVVHGIVNDHRGAVIVESVPGKGSCFTVFLPEAVEKADKTNTPREHNHHKPEGNILVVDDEQPITFFLVQVLEHLGYKVKACVSSEAAYAVFFQQQEMFDLIITDMGMPGMTGLELAEKIRKIKPYIPVMLCTGYSEHVTVENYQHLGLAGFVAKPFSAETLAREVARIMRETKKSRSIECDSSFLTC